MSKIKKVICRDINDVKSEVSSEELIWRPSIYGILIEDRKVLLSKQWDGYDLPGGGADIHETVEETLKREFFEETGLKVNVLDVVHCETDFFNPSHSKKHKNQYWNCPLIYFLVKKIGGEISIENFDEEEKEYADMPEWIEIEKLSEVILNNSVDSESVIQKAFKIHEKKK